MPTPNNPPFARAATPSAYHAQRTQLLSRGAIQAMFALLYLRILGALIDTLGYDVASKATTFLIVGFVFIAFLLMLRWPREFSLWLLGWFVVIGACFVSMFANDLLSNAQAWSFIVQMALYTCFLPVFFLMAQSEPRFVLRHADMFIKFFIVVGLLASLYQIASGNVFVTQTAAATERVYGTAGHPVSFSLQLTSAVVILEVVRQRLNKPLPWLFYGIALFTIVLTQSRTAWLVVALIGVFYGISRVGSTMKPIYLLILAVFAVAVVHFTGRFDDLSTLPQFFENTDFEADSYQYQYVNNSLEWRIANWALSLNAALLKPLLGYGPGQTTSVSLFDLQMHNVMLEIFVQLGFIGLLGFCLMLFGHFPILRMITSQGGIKRLTAVYLGVLLLAATFGTSMIYQTVTIIFYLMALGLACAKPPPTTARHLPS